MAFNFVCDGGGSVGSISKSNSLRRQVKSREYNSLLAFCCIFQLPVYFSFGMVIVDHVILGSFLECNDVFFGKINIHESGCYSLFSDILECETGTNVFEEPNTCFAVSGKSIEI